MCVYVYACVCAHMFTYVCVSVQAHQEHFSVCSTTLNRTSVPVDELGQLAAGTRICHKPKVKPAAATFWVTTLFTFLPAARFLAAVASVRKQPCPQCAQHVGNLLFPQLRIENAVPGWSVSIVSPGLGEGLGRG